MGGDSGIPIGVFAYNRPEHLRLTLEALGRCRGYKDFNLHIFCDGPKGPSDVTDVEGTRTVGCEWVAAHGGELMERERNIGFENIVSGITQLCDQYGQAVIVEDDIVVSPDFLEFMRAGLHRYAKETRVFSVTGFMFPLGKLGGPNAFFLPHNKVWGWATWRRAWRQYRPFPTQRHELLDNPARRRRFDFNGAWPYSRLLEMTMTGRINTWDIQWHCIVSEYDGMVLCPPVSLVWNTGLGHGVHFSGGQEIDTWSWYMQGTSRRRDFRCPRLPAGWTFPERTEVDEDAFRKISKHLSRATGPLPLRAARKLWLAMKRFLGSMVQTAG